MGLRALQKEKEKEKRLSSEAAPPVDLVGEVLFHFSLSNMSEYKNKINTDNELKRIEKCEAKGTFEGAEKGGCQLSLLIT